MDDAPRSVWSIDKHINLGHLLTTVAMMSGLLVWGARMEQRLAILEDRANRQEVAVSSALLDLKSEVKETNRKLDRLIESSRK